jgi:hypothetical protein
MSIYVVKQCSVEKWPLSLYRFQAFFEFREVELLSEQKERNAMAILQWGDRINAFPEIPASAPLTVRESVRRKHLVGIILLVIAGFQFVNLPGALVDRDLLAFGTIVLGLLICGVAMLFNRGGKATISSILLIVVVDLGCGLMLLTSPMGLDVANLPVFDVLVVSVLIAVSLLPAISVFPIALINILFIIAVLSFQPRTPELNMVLHSGMALDVIAQPIALQLIVALVTYLWVRSAQRAITRADRAEEIAELQQREAERSHQLETGIQQLLQTQVRAANGDLTVRANLSQDNLLWKVGVSLNMLLTRLQKSGREASRAEYENQQLRREVVRLTEYVREARADRHFVP